MTNAASGQCCLKSSREKMWRLHLRSLLWLLKWLALLQVIEAKLIEPGDTTEKTIQYGCVNYDMAVELLTKVKLIETRSENMLLKLNNMTPDSKSEELSPKDHEKIIQNLKETIKTLLENQQKVLSSEFSKEHFQTVLEAINESLKKIKRTQTELHEQSKILDTKLNGKISANYEGVLNNFLRTLDEENSKLAESLQVALTKILEHQNTRLLDLMSNQTIEMETRLADFNNNLSNNFIPKINQNIHSIIQLENEALKDLLYENYEETFKAEIEEFKKSLTTQSFKCDEKSNSNSELQDFITMSIENAYKEQKKLLLEALEKPTKAENLKYSPKYLSSTTGICNAKYGLPENCEEALRGNTKCGEGVYLLYVPDYDLDPFFAYCLPDQVTPSLPTWTIIQRRQNSIVNFNRGWNDYRDGFGDVKGSYWLGLKYIHALTSRRNYELWAEMEDWEGAKRYATYDKFVVGSEKNKFPLSLLGRYGGNAGDSLTLHIGQKFTTFDADNDDRKNGNCAAEYTGGWWFADCHVSNPNGIYNSTEYAKGINWKSWHGYKYSLKTFLLAIRPRKN